MTPGSERSNRWMVWWTDTQGPEMVGATMNRPVISHDVISILYRFLAEGPTALRGRSLNSSTASECAWQVATGRVLRVLATLWGRKFCLVFESKEVNPKVNGPGKMTHEQWRKSNHNSPGCWCFVVVVVLVLLLLDCGEKSYAWHGNHMLSPYITNYAKFFVWTFWTIDCLRPSRCVVCCCYVPTAGSAPGGELARSNHCVYLALDALVVRGLWESYDLLRNERRDTDLKKLCLKFGEVIYLVFFDCLFSAMLCAVYNLQHGHTQQWQQKQGSRSWVFQLEAPRYSCNSTDSCYTRMRSVHPHNSSIICVCSICHSKEIYLIPIIISSLFTV